MDSTHRTQRADGYDITMHQVGGREPDGSPSFIGPWTFRTKMVRDIVEDHLTGRVLNACAGKTELTHTAEIVRNDLNPDRDAEYHYDVCEIDEHFDENSFDTVVFDPPFDQAQADEHYKSMHARQLEPARQALATLVRPGGAIIELGWNAHGASSYPGWSRDELHIFQRGPCLQPVFLVVDRNYQTNLVEVGALAD